MRTLVEVLMSRDGMTEAGTRAEIAECREAMLEALDLGEDAEEVFTDWFGLEPDYIFEIL